MGLFSSPLGIIVGILSSVILIIVVLVVVTGGLALTGGPDACTPGGGGIVVNDANAQAFDDKWDQMDALLDAGNATSITLNESEVTSRADRFLSENGGDVKEIRVCIHEGFGEATGKVDLPVGEAKFKASGTVDLSGDHPEAQFDDVEVGNVPGVVLSPFEDAVEEAIQELLDDINLKHNYSVILEEGLAVIQGAPGTAP
jgi:hypothetical protein